jgi:hypothetical protein
MLGRERGRAPTPPLGPPPALGPERRSVVMTYFGLSGGIVIHFGIQLRAVCISLWVLPRVRRRPKIRPFRRPNLSRYNAPRRLLPLHHSCRLWPRPQ